MCYIEPDECIDCGVCVEACPVAAIYDEKELPSDQQEFAEVNLLWFKDKAAARTRVDELA
jgi:ferredoxin